MTGDTELQRNIMAELRWDPSINAAAIGVAVKDGIVTLTGNVDTYAQKVAAERTVQRVAGVYAIADELEVRIAGDLRRTDEDIRARRGQRPCMEHGSAEQRERGCP